MFYVYLLASRRNGTLYCGMTNDLLGRVYEHKARIATGFTRKYNVTKLVWFETHDLVNNAITREKRIKRWPRAWKIDLIEERNPDWCDLYYDLGGTDPDKILPGDHRLRS